MNKKKYSDNTIIKDILAGGSKRDQALKYLLLESNYHDLVKSIIHDCGKKKKVFDRVYEKCLILLDKKIRRFKFRINDSFESFFKNETKLVWSSELRNDKELRDEVISCINTDKNLRQQIYYTIKKNSGQIEDAEDCYQNGLILLNNKLQDGAYNGGAIKGFFYTLCYNLWRNELKKNKPLSIDTEIYNYHIDKEDPLVVLEKKERNSLLKEAFYMLGESCRKLIELKYFITGNITMTEIAGQMGYKNAQIASNALTKCRKKLLGLFLEIKS